MGHARPESRVSAEACVGYVITLLSLGRGPMDELLSVVVVLEYHASVVVVLEYHAAVGLRTAVRVVMERRSG